MVYIKHQSLKSALASTRIPFKAFSRLHIVCQVHTSLIRWSCVKTIVSFWQKPICDNFKNRGTGISFFFYWQKIINTCSPWCKKQTSKKKKRKKKAHWPLLLNYGIEWQCSCCTQVKVNLRWEQLHCVHGGNYCIT